jgi:hypothetical protein
MVMMCPGRVVTPSTIDAVLAQIFDEEMRQAKFEKVGPRKYVRSRIHAVREVIELRSSTVTMILCWGFSFDFVPHIAGRQTESVRWHRTPKSAFRDLWYSSIDNAVRPVPPGAEMYLNAGESRLRDDALQTRAVVLPKAIAHLSAPQYLLSFRSLFEVEEQKKESAFFNYYQLALAYAFFLAKIRDAERARKYMSKWLTLSHHREETQQKLSELFERIATAPINVQ